jgi:hypothetical protein
LDIGLISARMDFLALTGQGTRSHRLTVIATISKFADSLGSVSSFTSCNLNREMWQTKGNYDAPACLHWHCNELLLVVSMFILRLCVSVLVHNIPKVESLFEMGIQGKMATVLQCRQH